MTTATAIIGLQWGDEGKGKIVDLYAASADVVVRCNGGANAGHSVEFPDGRRLAVHLLPSAVGRDGVSLLLGRGMVVELDRLIAEMDDMREKNPRMGDIVVDPRIHVVLPIHQMLDAHREEDPARRAGSTRRGIGPAYADRYARDGITLGEILFDESSAEEKFRGICDRGRRILALGEDVLSPAVMRMQWEKLCGNAWVVYRKAAIQDGGAYVRNAWQVGGGVLFVVAHGALLDIYHGTYPHVTSSACGIGAVSTTGFDVRQVNHVVGVVKAYSTRIGTGPMPTEIPDLGLAGLIRKAGREYGTTTGRPRRIGWLDLHALRYACRVNGVNSITLTMADVLAAIPDGEAMVCLRYQDIPFGELPHPASAHERVTPIYEILPEMNATMEQVQEIRRAQDLPKAIRRLIQMIEEHTGVMVSLVSVGPRRDQVVALR